MKMVKIILCSIVALALVSSTALSATDFLVDVNPTNFPAVQGSPYAWDTDPTTDDNGSDHQWYWQDTSGFWSGGYLGDRWAYGGAEFEGNEYMQIENVTNTSSFAGSYAGLTTDIDVYVRYGWTEYWYSPSSQGQRRGEAILNDGTPVQWDSSGGTMIAENGDGKWELWEIYIGTVTSLGDISVKLNTWYPAPYESDPRKPDHTAMDAVRFAVNDLVPEPVTLTILALGGAAALLRRRK